MTPEELAVEAVADLRKALDIAKAQGERAKKLLKIASICGEALSVIAAGKGTVDAQLIAQEALIVTANEWKK